VNPDRPVGLGPGTVVGARSQRLYRLHNASKTCKPTAPGTNHSG